MEDVLINIVISLQVIFTGEEAVDEGGVRKVSLNSRHVSTISQLHN